MTEEQTSNQQTQADALKQFNNFQAQIRLRVEATIKSVFLISGGMLTLSVGAVLGEGSNSIPLELLPTLKFAWSMLFYSLSAALLLMFLLVVSEFHVGIKWSKKLEGNDPKVETITTFPWLRVVNWAVGISALVSCLTGLGLMASVALGVAGASIGDEHVTQVHSSPSSLHRPRQYRAA